MSREALRVLLTNHGLDHRGGTELYIRDVALGLLRRGHAPVVFSPVLGTVAAEIEAAGVPVVSSLEGLGEAPDIIHAQHHLPGMAALLRYPAVPAVSVCHGFLHWLEAPVHSPQVRRYLAVDDACRERLITKEGIPPERVRVVLNFADERRFFRRETPLPERPKTALLISNYASLAGPTRVIREACERLGITLSVYGMSSGQVLARPEEALRSHDLVFAKGRAAIEALMCGAAVIPYHDDSFGPLVTAETFDALRRRNFGFSIMQYPLTTSALAAEIACYDAEDCRRAADLMEGAGSLERALDELLEVYREALSDAAREAPGAAAQASTVDLSRYLESIAGEVLGAGRLAQDLRMQRREREEAERMLIASNESSRALEARSASQLSELEASRADCAALATMLEEARSASEELEMRSAAASEETLRLEAALRAAEGSLAAANAERSRILLLLREVERSRTFRLKNFLSGLPGVPGALRLLGAFPGLRSKAPGSTDAGATSLSSEAPTIRP